MSSHNKRALTALILSLPIAILLFAAIFEISFLERALSAMLMNDGFEPTRLGNIVMVGGVAVLPIALLLASWSLIRKGFDGKRHFYLFNVIVALLIIALMIPTWGGLLKDVYQCDVLHDPSCD